MMDKSCDTQLLSPRQVLFLGPATSNLKAMIDLVLGPPQYILMSAHDLDTASEILRSRKIEILLFEPEAGRTRSQAALGAIKAADPAVEIVVVAPRLTLVATVATLQGAGDTAHEFDYLGTPVSGPELVRSVERARELRYLRRSEERRRGAEARMSAVVQAVPYAVISVDDRGTIHDWNLGAKTIFGWSAAEAVGRRLGELAVPASALALHTALTGVQASAPARMEITGRRRGGEEFPALAALARVPLEGRAMFCIVLEDVTEARRMEVELRHAQKLEAVGRLASGLAHEINTPCQFVGSHGAFLADAFKDLDGLVRVYEQLRCEVAAQAQTSNVVALLARVVQAEESSDLEFLREQTPAALASIAEGVGRIAALVGAMKDFAQPEMGDPTTIDLNQALESTLTVIQHQVRAVGDIERRFGDLPVITGLSAEINQALLGIVLNAIQALGDRQQQTGERGLIIVETRTVDAGATVEVAITDNGPGIPEAIRGRIFDPFFTTRDVGRGSGQGLSVARSVIVDKHGGTLTFDSQVGVKTTFFVRLPADRRGRDIPVRVFANTS